MRSSSLALCLVLLLAAAARAQTSAFSPLARRVMVMLDTRDGESFEDNDIQHLMALPLWHLGLRVVYRDLAAGALPSDPEMEDYRGVIAFAQHADCNEAYRTWLLSQRREGRKLLLLSSLTPSAEPEVGTCEEDDEDVNRLLEPLGLVYSSVLTSEGAEDQVAVRYAAPDWFGKELGFEELPRLPYQFLRSVGPRNASRLRVWIDGIDNSEADMVVTGDWGGFAVTEYLWGERKGRDFRYWLIDPLRFLEAAFGWEGKPRVEANVLGGRRVFFSHIDGDGYNSFAYDRPSKICGEIVYEEILQNPEYSMLPQTISLISAEVDPTTTHVEPASIPTAQRIFDLDHVEAASHAFTHPMDWREGELAFEDVAVDGRPYQFDRRKETVGSLERIAALSPKGRAPRVMLWSGSCNPDEETLRILRETPNPDGKPYRNMNGGDPRLDDEYDSLSQVAPPVWQVGDEVRFSSGAANDYLMTNEWTPPFTGFRNIIQTFRNTEVPRPLTPVDVYYHFYIAERQVAFRTLKTVFDWCRKKDFAHLFVSEYLDMMEDLLEVRLEEGDGWFRVHTRGKLPTIRFDDVPGYVDMGTARGVQGYRRRWGSLYVFLDASEEHVFRLVPEEASGLRLLEASRPVQLLPTREGELAAFRGTGFGFTELRFAGLPANAFAAVQRRGGPPSAHGDVILQVDPEGVLGLRVELGRGAEVRVLSSSAAAYESHLQELWFADEGRYALLLGALTVLGWLLCRFYLPELRAARASYQPRRPRVREGGLEVDPVREEPRSSEGLPAGGVGPWAAGDLSSSFPVDGDDEGEDR